MPIGPFHTTVLNARLRLHLTQKEVAARIGSTQPAVSDFENGKLGSLGNEKIEKFAELVGVKMPDTHGQVSEDGPTKITGQVLAFCPCPDCPEGVPISLNGKEVIRPVTARIDGGMRMSFCKSCGTALESGCRECLTELMPDAAFCTGCGLALVKVAPLPAEVDLEEMVERRRVRGKQYWEVWADVAPVETYPRPEPRNAGRRRA